MGKTCYIFASGSYDNKSIECFNDESLIIAADGGYDYCVANNINVDIIVGDFDSIKNNTNDHKCLKFSREKDETDTLLAIDYGIKQGYKTFVIYGGLGNRIDHTLGNIQLLKYMLIKNCKGYLISDEQVVCAIDKEIYFNNTYKGYISILSIDDVSNITIKGLKYEITNYDIVNSYPLGISNEFIL